MGARGLRPGRALTPAPKSPASSPRGRGLSRPYRAKRGPARPYRAAKRRGLSPSYRAPKGRGPVPVLHRARRGEALPLAHRALKRRGPSTTRTCGCSSRPASRAARSSPGYGCVRCTGPLAMSIVVWPERLTLLDVRALGDQVQDHLVVAARRRRGARRCCRRRRRRSRRRRASSTRYFTAGSMPARRDVVRVAGEAEAIADARGRLQRRRHSGRRPAPAAGPTCPRRRGRHLRGPRRDTASSSESSDRRRAATSSFIASTSAA